MKCPQCGTTVTSGSGTCTNCGARIHYGGNTVFVVKSARAELSIQDFFSDAFKKHPSGMGARMFVAGTPGAIPSPDKMLSEWNKPWLFTRVIGIGLLFSLMSFLMAVVFGHPLGTVLLFTLGPLVLPLGILTFYWEISIPRDIPLYRIVVIFLIGGMLSLLFTLLLPRVGYEFLAPLTEEPGKVLALALFVYLIDSPYIFDGLLVGAAVGAGFSAFENIHYVMNVAPGDLSILIMRSVLAIGGHVTWAAIEGGALVWAKGSERLQVKHFFSSKFLRYLLACMAMHCAWNMPVYLLPLPLVADLKYVLLSAAAIATAFSLIRKAIAQVLAISDGAHSEPVTDVLSLRILYQPMAGAVIPLTKRIVIGRDPSRCNLVMPNGDGISRVHCAVEQLGGSAYIMDLGSTYGVFLDQGGRIPANKWVKVSGQFYIGSPKVRFSIES